MTKKIFVLGLIVALAIFFRFKGLDNNPPGFYTDEASIGYNAYTILKSGRDEHGVFMPMFFEAFGEYKNAFAIYPVAVTMKLLGPTELAVRTTHAFWGVLDVIAIFFLAKLIWDFKVGLAVAGVLATAPWHIHLSRFMIESHNMFLFFVIVGTYFFFRMLDKLNNLNLILTAVSFGLALYTYFAVRIFMPFYLLGLWRINFSDIKKTFTERKKIYDRGLAIFILLCVPFLWHILSGKGLERFKQVSAVKGEKSIVNLITKTLKLYYDHYNPNFVFFTGDSGFPGQTNLRHSVLGIGLMPKWQLPFFLAGLCLMASKLKINKEYQAIIFMLLIYPLGSLASNTMTPLATRSVVGIIPYSLIIGYGIINSISIGNKLRPRRLWGWGITLFVIVTGLFYTNRYLQLSKAYINMAHGYAGFQYGAKEIVRYFQSRQNDYDALILGKGFDGGQAYIDFFSLGDCQKCSAGDLRREDSSRKKLIAVDPGEMEDFNRWYTGETEKVIYYPDGREAFYLMNAMSKQGL